MEKVIFIKVIGFRDDERHALNTLFRLSSGRSTAYCLWTPEAPLAPQLALIDMDSYEAGLVLSLPGQNPKLKMICVGQDAPANAWRVFDRPLNWPDVVSAMDDLFEPAGRKGGGKDYTQTIAARWGVKVSLLVDPSRENRMYLRARLALAGHTDTDEAGNGAKALVLAKKHHYDLVIVGLDIPDIDSWELIRQLIALAPAIGHVVVISPDASVNLRNYAEASGCHGLLQKPFDPLEVISLLQSV